MLGLWVIPSGNISLCFFFGAITWPNSIPASPVYPRDGIGAPPNGTGKCRTGLPRDCRNLCSLPFDCLRDLAADLVIRFWPSSTGHTPALRHRSRCLRSARLAQEAEKNLNDLRGAGFGEGAVAPPHSTGDVNNENIPLTKTNNSTGCFDGGRHAKNSNHSAGIDGTSSHLQKLRCADLARSNSA